MDKIIYKARSFISILLLFLQVSRLRFVCCQTITYGKEGGTIRLICPFSPAEEYEHATWNGPPLLYPYFIDELKNFNLARSKRERLALLKNNETGGSDLKITGLTREDVGQYSCLVTSFPAKQLMIYLILYLPPSSIFIDSYNDNGILRVNGTEGFPLNLSCQSPGGDPAANVSWYKDSGLLSTGINKTVYNFIPTRDDDLQIYTCTSYDPDLSEPMRNNVQIFLDLKPGVPEFPKIPLIKENDEIMVTCSSSGGRPAASLWWIFRGTYLKPTYVTSTIDPLTQTYTVNAVLNLTVNKEDNEKNIICMANNSVVPTGRQSFQMLTVLYKLKSNVFKLKGGQAVNESTPISVFCSVDSPSFTNMSIRNQKTNEILSTVVFTNTLNFTEKSARCFHTAPYICTAENRKGSTASDPMWIYVYCGPRSLDGLYFLQIAAPLNQTLEISANYLSYPISSVQWSFRQTSTSPEVSLTGDFQRTSISINISSFSVHLKKTALEEEDFGYYTVRVSNDYGSFMTTFYIIPQGNQEAQINSCKSSSTASEVSVLVPVLASISTVFFIVCAGLVTFIILKRRCNKMGLDMCCFQESANGHEDYVMQNGTKMDDHQYQDIGVDQKKMDSSGKHMKSITKNGKNIEDRNVYDVVENNEDVNMYLNVS